MSSILYNLYLYDLYILYNEFKAEEYEIETNFAKLCCNVQMGIIHSRGEQRL